MALKFLVDPLVEPEADYREINRRHEVYLRYLESTKDLLPPSSFTFATASWHWDVNDHRCLHDSQLESLDLTELHSQGDPGDRRINVKVDLLGPFHDKRIHLEYLNVTKYELTMSKKTSPWPSSPSTTHGDWLIDEVRLSEDGNVENEIIFSLGARWIIECSDIRYYWEDIL